MFIIIVSYAYSLTLLFSISKTIGLSNSTLFYKNKKICDRLFFSLTQVNYFNIYEIYFCSTGNLLTILINMKLNQPFHRTFNHLSNRYMFILGSLCQLFMVIVSKAADNSHLQIRTLIGQDIVLKELSKIIYHQKMQLWMIQVLRNKFRD